MFCYSFLQVLLDIYLNGESYTIVSQLTNILSENLVSMAKKRDDGSMMMMRYVCPSFSGRREECENWKIVVEDCLLLSEGEVKCHGAEI
jgi:hypothetical protein